MLGKHSSLRNVPSSNRRVDFHYQPHRFRVPHGNTQLGLSRKVFWESVNWGKMTERECEQHHPLGWSCGLNKEGERWVVVLISLSVSLSASCLRMQCEQLLTTLAATARALLPPPPPSTSLPSNPLPSPVVPYPPPLHSTPLFACFINFWTILSLLISFKKVLMSPANRFHYPLMWKLMVNRHKVNM